MANVQRKAPQLHHQALAFFQVGSHIDKNPITDENNDAMVDMSNATPTTAPFGEVPAQMEGFEKSEMGVPSDGNPTVPLESSGFTKDMDEAGRDVFHEHIAEDSTSTTQESLTSTLTSSETEQSRALNVEPSASAASNYQAVDSFDELSTLVPTMFIFFVGALSIYCRRPKAKGLCQKVSKIPVTSGAAIQSMFGMLRDNEKLPQQPLCPGLLMRLEGRIVAKPGGKLSAPFSGRPCVFYSASVSHQRCDSVHAPPLACHTLGTDFLLELSDAPVSISVCSHDVALFSMINGLQVRQQAFMDAPETWRGFLVAHLLPSSSSAAKLDLGPSGVALEFRECALLLGAAVTCMGTVVRDQDGNLCLHPWQPLANLQPLALVGSGDKDGLAGCVMVSDDSCLRGQEQTFLL